jgi:hypothetical protein
MAQTGPGDVCADTYQKPTDHDPGDSLPAPAPAGPYSTSLSAFDLTDPNGTWRLWVADDTTGDEGFFTEHFVLQISTRPGAATSFGASQATAEEGTAALLTVNRSGAGAYAAGSVTVTSTPGSASEADYEPVSTTLNFEPGQTQRTLSVETRADGEGEDAETFTVALGSPSGDARLVSPSAATITIPASPATAGDGDDDTDGGGGDDTDGGGADATAPETTIVKAPKPKTRRAQATFEFASGEPGSRFECAIDGQAWAPCSSPLRIKHVKRGRHRFAVRAIDAAGNADQSPAQVRWKRRKTTTRRGSR